MLLSVSFRTYRKRGRNVLMGRQSTYHQDVLVRYHWNVVGCFVWNLFEMSRRRTDQTSLLRPLKKLSRSSKKILWRRTTDVLATFWQAKIFSWLCHFLILVKSKLDMKFYENPIRCSWTDWLADSGVFIWSLFA